MLPKYSVDYTINFRRHALSNQFSTDDPVGCVEFLAELLERGATIKSVKHEGVDLPRNDFDKMVKSGAGMMASRHLCVSLGIKPDEEHYRFGFAG